MRRSRGSGARGGRGSPAAREVVPRSTGTLQETIGLDDDEISILWVLMLRGPQTPGELKQRTERLHPFGPRPSIERALDGLIERELAARLERRPGQKEERYAQLLGGEVDASAAADETRPLLARDPLRGARRGPRGRSRSAQSRARALSAARRGVPPTPAAVAIKPRGDAIGHRPEGAVR